MSNPGGWVRKQARNQTIKALAYSGGVAGLVVAPFLISLLLPINAGLGVLIGLGCWVGATVLREQARQLWIEAKKANQGSVGEKNVAKLLKPLKRLGWTIEYNIPQRRWGDADVFGEQCDFVRSGKKGAIANRAFQYRTYIIYIQTSINT